MKIDDIDLQIIRHLWDGRTPFKEIAEKIDLTTNTVRNRVKRLTDNGILKISGLVDPKAISGTTSATVFFKVDFKEKNRILQDIAKIKNVVAASILSGCYDIIADTMFNEKYTHEQFILEELPKIKGIKSVETAFHMESVNNLLWYVL